MANLMAKGTIWMMIAHISLLISGYAIHFCLGKSFTPGDYGRFGLTLTLLTLIEICVSQGIPQTVNKFISEDVGLARAIKDTAIRIQLIFATMLFIMYFLFASTISTYLGIPGFTELIQLSAIDIPFFALFTFYAYGIFGGLRRFDAQTNLLIVYSALKVILVLLFVHLGYGIYGAIAGYVLASVLGFLISYWLCDLLPTKEKYEPKRIVSFSLPLIIFSISITAIMSLDLIFVQMLLGDEALTGYYTSATLISKLPYYLFLSLSATLLPSISGSIARDDLVQTRAYIRGSLRYILLLIVPVTLAISVTASDILALIYPPQYVLAAGSLSILIFGLTFLSLFVVLATIVTAGGKPMISMTMVVFLIPVNMLLNIGLIPTYRLVGAASATTATGILGLTIISVYVYKKFNALLDPKSLMNILLASSMMYASSQAIQLSGPWIFITYALMLFTYMISLFILKEISDEDIALFRGIMPRIRGIS